MNKAALEILRRGRDAGVFGDDIRNRQLSAAGSLCEKAAGFVNDLLGRPLASSAELDRRDEESQRLDALAEKARRGEGAVAKKRPRRPLRHRSVRARAKRIEDVLKGRGIPYRVLGLTDDESTRSWALTKAQATEFPLLFVAGESVGGFEQVLSLDATGGLTKKCSASGAARGTSHLHLDGQTLRTRVYTTHPDRVVDVELSSDATARLLTAAAPF